MASSTGKKTRSLSPERIYDLLMTTRTADEITVCFKDGRVITGALVFNHLKGTGRLINVDQELSLDFAIDEVRDLRS
ncbi:MAG: hypothetical protein P1V81_16695 [Planctomycetota bacterium]|nr:hypothetical protein [Planctomycetota bacterium]